MDVCIYRCNECPYDDCIAASVPLEDTDVYMQFHLDETAKSPSWLFTIDEQLRNNPTIKPVRGLLDAQEPEFAQWCRAHNVRPSVPADIAILRRAYDLGFSGKKLEKALYKVRHREQFLEQKRRSRLSGSGRKASG